MRALALVVCAALSLSGCDTVGRESPAPLSRTVIDDHGIRYAFLTLDTLASLADAGVKAGWLVPRSALALSVANGLDKVRHALNAASHAQRAGSLRDYQAAFDEAQRAMIEVQKALAHRTSLLQPRSTMVSLDDTINRLRAA
jgi:hypothetical protein